MTTKTNRQKVIKWAETYRYKTVKSIAKKLYGENDIYEQKKVMYLLNRMQRQGLITITKRNAGIEFHPVS